VLDRRDQQELWALLEIQDQLVNKVCPVQVDCLDFKEPQDRLGSLELLVHPVLVEQLEELVKLVRLEQVEFLARQDLLGSLVLWVVLVQLETLVRQEVQEPPVKKVTQDHLELKDCKEQRVSLAPVVVRVNKGLLDLLE